MVNYVKTKSCHIFFFFLPAPHPRDRKRWVGWLKSCTLVQSFTVVIATQIEPPRSHFINNRWIPLF